VNERAMIRCALVLVLAALLARPAEAAAPAIKIVPVAQLGASPVGISNAGDGSGRLFVLLKAGKILIYSGGEVLPVPFLDIRDRVSQVDEQGLLGLAFHPDYAENGQFYVYYSDLAGNSVISRFNVSPTDPNAADPDSEAVVLTIPHFAPEHYAGQMQFGPEGYLYIPSGDGSPQGDPDDRAQDLGLLLGKILRIDVDSGDPYAIPPTNPFVGVPGVLPEIWAYGLRNPWRISFDSLTGDLYIADVGQDNWEEVNLQPASSPGGENYGWRLMEGRHCYNPPMDCYDESLTLPFAEYPHFNEQGLFGCAVIGGNVYRGGRFPLLEGLYFFGDWCTGKIWGTLEKENGSRKHAQLLDTGLSITAFGQDEAGEIYLVETSTNTLYNVVDTRPFCDVEIAKAVYTEGETVAASVRRLVNLGDTDVAVRLRMAMERPTGSPILLVDKGADGSFEILAGEDKDAGSKDLFTVGPKTQRGQWFLSCKLNDPVTGKLLASDDSPFLVQ
jgi:glucose/arabinose dehydrogenase